MRQIDELRPIVRELSRPRGKNGFCRTWPRSEQPTGSDKWLLQIVEVSNARGNPRLCLKRWAVEGAP
jgi:hypothetical protein